MKTFKRIAIFGLLAAVLFAVPVAVFANKQIFKAVLTTDAELHDVIGSNARGAGILGLTPGGVRFQVSVNGLSGDALSAHIHGPADEQQNGPIVVTLCGGPPPAVLAECTMENGTLKIMGTITNQIVGMTNAEFQDALQDGLLYINVHTQLNPAGEVRGQLYPH